MNLAAIFHPTPTADFLVEYFNFQPLHAPGAAARFASLANDCAAAFLSYDLERELEAPIRLDAVTESVAPHRPPHDVIALQLSGETRWNIFGRAAAASPEPEQSFALEPGGALYLPRSLWRTVQSPHAHASSRVFHIQNPTGAGFLAWMADKMKENDAFQSDIPRFAGPAVQTEYLTRLRKTFRATFRQPSLLRRYSLRLNRLAPAHPAPGSPWDAQGPHSRLIALATARTPTIFRTDRETIHVFSTGEEIHFPEDAAPLLQYVIDRAPVSIADFYRQFEPEFECEELASFLAALSRDGLITLLDPENAAL